MSDGRTDFDFLLGEWTIENRKLGTPLDPSAGDWAEFPATATNRAILGGLGNIDDYRAPELPGRPGFIGAALRLYDPDSGLWRVWWASTAGNGMLDTPVSGRFDGDHAVFESRETLDGIELGVRYEWHRHSLSVADWQQSFSFDSGASWRPNWQMHWTRTGPGPAA